MALTLTDSDAIKELNLEFRGIDASTDVLSFPMVDFSAPACFDGIKEGDMSLFEPDTGELNLGDIVINLERVIQQAREYGHSERREFTFLIIHSMLHLLGFDHEEIEDEKLMFAKQDEIGILQPDGTYERVNLVVMMNEAFSDLSVLGGFPVNQDYMPFTRSLLNGAENTASGHLHVSVLGGNTANTEFEFLTGDTMAFLPDGSIPYQQYMRFPVPSLAKDLSAYGYRTIAAHPYRATGWSRNEAYAYMGFSEMLFLPEFQRISPTYLRKFVDDMSCVRLIQTLFEEKGEEPLFIFNVTMQNHSSYKDAFENLTEEVSTGLKGAAQLDRYLSLIKKSDETLEEMVRYFSAKDEPVMVVFFGDHQPNLAVSQYVYRANGKKTTEIADEEKRLQYIVPFIIWTNYDTEEKTGMEISANFLANEALLRMRVPLSPYRAFLEELRKAYPVVSTQTFADDKGRLLDLKRDGERLSAYRLLQYYSLFDEEGNS